MEWHLTSEGGSGGLPGGSAAEVGPAGEQGLVGKEALQAGVGNGGGRVCLSGIPRGRCRKEGRAVPHSRCDSLAPFYVYF